MTGMVLFPRFDPGGWASPRHAPCSLDPDIPGIHTPTLSKPSSAVLESSSLPPGKGGWVYPFPFMGLERVFQGATGRATRALCPQPPSQGHCLPQDKEAQPAQAQSLMSAGITQHCNTAVLEEVLSQHQGRLRTPNTLPVSPAHKWQLGGGGGSPNPPDRHLRTSRAPAPPLGRPKPHTRNSPSRSAHDTLMNFPSSRTHQGQSSRNRPSVSRPWTPEPIQPVEMCYLDAGVKCVFFIYKAPLL